MDGHGAIVSRLVLALIGTTLVPATARAQTRETVSYTVELEPRADRTDLNVLVTIGGDWPASVAVRPPSNCYGSLSMAEFLTTPTLAGGEALASGSAESGWTLDIPPENEVTLTYRMSLPPGNMRGAFAPNTSASHLHVAGCQWMLMIGEPDSTRIYSVRIPDAPPGWEVYSTWGRGGTPGSIEGDYDDIASTAIGGQAGASSSFEVRGRPVDVYVADGFAVPPAEIVSMVGDIVAYQRNLMGVYDFPFYFVAIRPGDGVIAGTSVDHMFVAFIKPEATRFEIGRIVSHEMFHVFLPHALEIFSPDDDSSARFLWFHEGVTDYMAREVLVDLGIISRDEALASLNADLLALADSPYATWPYARLRRSVETSGYSQGSMKFNYYRGALIAARWDHLLKAREGGGLGRLLRSMIAEASDTDGRMPEDRFFEIGTEHGLDIEGDFQRYVLNGEPILPPVDYAEGYELATVRAPRFDLGFDIAESRREGVVTGVREDGPAYRAGLRDGMSLVRTRNTSRDTNSWDAEAPVVIVVRDGAEERAIAYMPAGELHEVVQYVRVRAGKKPRDARGD